MKRIFTVVLLAGSIAISASAQQRKPAPGAPPPPPPPAPEPVKKEPANVSCPAPLGVGVRTRAAFCDVMTGRDPAEGIIIKLPPHDGPVSLTFDLHNRHMYSQEEMQGSAAYRRYTATIGVLTMDNTLVSRAVVQNEFRTAADLLDRVGGGAGAAGLKAVAPTGTESIVVMVPAQETQVSVLGEKLIVERADGTAVYAQPGRAIADISDVMIEYRPPAPPPPPAPAKSKAPPAKRTGQKPKGKS